MTKEQVYKIGITGLRRNGNTTRIIDALVQELFTTGKCEYWDHADHKGNVVLDHTLRSLQSRLFYEHGLKQNAGYTVNKKDRVIKLTPNRP